MLELTVRLDRAIYAVYTDHTVETRSPNTAAAILAFARPTVHRDANTKTHALAMATACGI